MFRNTLSLALIIILVGGSPTLLLAQGPVYQDPNEPIEARVADLLSRMNLKEKVAQMRIFHARLGIELDEAGALQLSDDVKERLRYGIAGIKNPGEHLSPERAAKLNNALQRYVIEHNRWGIPGLFVTESYNGVDAEGCTMFGRPITLASSFDTALVRRVWDVVGREARLRGMHMCHSPEADIVRDPRFGRMSEAWGEDTYLTTEMVVSAIRGVQGDYAGLGAGTHIGAVAKHFAGYGQVLGGTNFAAIEISPRTLNDEIFPPFRAAVERAETLGIMASHGDLNGVASHANPELLTDILRHEWDFPGYVVSDANDIGRLHYFMKVAETPEDAALLGLKAGVDVDLYADDAYALLPEITKRNPEILPLIDQAAGRVLRTKFVLGLFDDPYVDERKVAPGVRSETALALAREADLAAITLLKNENGTLPLNGNGLKKLALLGPRVEEGTAEAFRNVSGDHLEITADRGFDLTDEGRSVPKLIPSQESDLKRLVKLAKRADVVILFLGGDEYTAKEAFFNGALGDRMDIHPVGPQDELIRRVKALGKPVVVVLQHRRTLAVNVIAEAADAILDGWDLSEFGDESLARVIFGEVNPSGRLPVTVPRSIGQLPFHYSGKEINNKKGYLFTENGPLYPFGYGLSYTEFRYAKPEISRTELYPGEKLTVSVEVSNVGARDGREVVQLYVKDEIGSVTRPDKELKGVHKIQLGAGESRRVSFTVDSDILAFTRLDGNFGLETGDYTVMIGPNSSEGESLRFRLEADTLHPRFIRRAMREALRWQEDHPIFAKDPTDWTNGAYYTGVVRAHAATEDPLFLKAAYDMAQRNQWKTWERFYHADDVAISYAYLYLNQFYPREANLEPTRKFLEDHFNKDHVWKKGDHNDHQVMLWWWCDALFMAPPVVAELARQDGDPALLEQLHTYYRQTHDFLFDEEENLFARDAHYLWRGAATDRKEANGNKIFWSRGNGWVLGGLALLLEALPEDYEHRPFYLDLYRKMAARIKSIQPEDGLWRVSLLAPESYDHGEVSGSGFYTFALAWGINNGILPEEAYRPTVEKAWRALAACQQADGMVGWVQNIGKDPQPATAGSWQNFGTGAFLMAGSEVMKLK